MTDVQERPWGGWKIVHEEGEGMLSRAVKVLMVNPGCMLSLQSHRYRTEFWVPLQSGLVAYCGDQSPKPNATYLKAFEPYAVYSGTTHRLINPGAIEISVVEIIVGKYDEEDIVRLHDAYGRV